VLLLGGRGVAAEVAGATATEGARLVVLESRFIGSDDVALRQALSELLGRIDVRIAPAGSLLSERVLARITIAPASDGARVIVEPVEPPGPVVRHQVPEAASPELFRETLAHVVLGAVEPLLEAQAEPPPSAPAQEDPSADRAEPERPPAPGDGARASWWLGARAGVLWFVPDGTNGVQVGAAGGATLDAPLQPGLALEGGYMIPLSLEREGLSATFSLVALRLRPSLQLFASPSVAVRAELAPGVNFITLSPESAGDDILSRDESSRVQPLLGFAGAAYFRLSHGLSAVARLGLDVDFAPRRWVIQGAEETVFFETSRFQPQTTLGLDWSPSEASP
jgi:hypothetical protein